MASQFTATEVALAMFRIQQVPSSSAREDAAAALKAFDRNVELAKQENAQQEEREELLNLPVERMRRGEVAPEHLRTVTVRGDGQRTSPQQSYTIPANSDTFSEMFKGQDIEIRNSPSTRNIRLND